MYLNNSSHANETLGWIWTPGQLLDHTKVTLYSILIVLTLPGNVLVIAVVFYNQNLRTNMNYLIVNMAVSDLLVPLVALPWMVSGYIVRPGEWLVEGPLGEALCKLVPLLSNISPYVSSMNLVIIAFIRFIAVVYPSRIQILTRKTRWILISFPWIVAMALLSPHFYISRLANEFGYTMCITSWSPSFNEITAYLIYYSILTIVGFAIPCVTVIILYPIIHYKLRKSLNSVIELIERKEIRSRQRRNRRLFHMSITIITVFTIGWFPLDIWYFLNLFRHPSFVSMDYETFMNIHFALIFLWSLIPAFNPYIYFVFLKDFRRGLKKLCCRETT